MTDKQYHPLVVDMAERMDVDYLLARPSTCVTPDPCGLNVIFEEDQPLLANGHVFTERLPVLGWELIVKVDVSPLVDLPEQPSHPTQTAALRLLQATSEICRRMAEDDTPDAPVDLHSCIMLSRIHLRRIYMAGMPMEKLAAIVTGTLGAPVSAATLCEIIYS